MIRKGQKLVNHIIRIGYNTEDIPRYIFYMPDEEFDKVMNMKVDYEIPHNEEGDKIIRQQADQALKRWKKKGKETL